MWYVGIILIIILFIAYMRSNMKNETEENLTKSDNEEKENSTIVEAEENNNYRRDYNIHRPATFRNNNQMRTSRHSKRTINRHSDGTPRGGGTGGNRGSSNNVGPSGGRR